MTWGQVTGWLLKIKKGLRIKIRNPFSPAKQWSGRPDLNLRPLGYERSPALFKRVRHSP